MNTWVVNTRPTEQDGTRFWVTYPDGTVDILSLEIVQESTYPWMKVMAPTPYIKPVRVRHEGLLTYSQGLPRVAGIESFDDDPDFDKLMKAIDLVDTNLPTTFQWESILAHRNANLV